MLQRGDYVVPYLNNRYRFDKPPLTYWCQTASYRLLGDNDFAARFPSAVAAALTALLLFAWGRRIGSERIAWWAAIIFTLCLQTILHAKAAVADMWLVFFMTAAQWAGYELLRDRLQPTEVNQEPPAVRWWWIFYGALALAFLAKGPIGWMPLLALGVTKWFLPELQLRRRFLFFTGSLLMVSLVAVWGIPALVRTEGLFFDVGIGRHVVGRSIGVMEGHGAETLGVYLAMLPFYFALIFLTFAPWSFKLPWLTKRLWRERDPLDCYLLAGVAVVFIIFTFVKTKLPHYTLPAFPLLALLLAKALASTPNHARYVRRTAFATGAVTLFLMALTPIAARYSPSWQLIRQARADLRPQMEFGAVKYREPSLLWYGRKYVHGWFVDLDETRLPAFFAKPGGRFAIMPSAMAAQLYPSLPETWKSYQTHGFNLATGHWLDLTLILKPDDS